MGGRSVLYNIRSKDDTKGGISSAMQNLKGFDSKLKGISGSMKGLLKYGAIAGAAVGVARAVGQISDAYRVQEKSEILLSQAVRNNPLLNGKSFEALKAYNSQLQGQSVYGDELLNAQAAQLAAQGRSEEQIKSILAASVDLAATGVMPLETAVKNLGKTYSGTAGRLTESVPALKDLTAEQLKNGEAVFLVAEQYRGMASAVAGSREGTKQQLSNLVGDIKEQMGEIWTNLTGDFNAKFLPIVEKINTWLSENKERIINFFRYIPEIAMSTFNLIKGIIGKIFTPEFWKVFGSIAWDTFKNQAKATFEFLGNVISAIAATFWEPLKWAFQTMVFGIKVVFTDIVNMFADKLNTLAKGAHDIWQKITHPFNESNREEFQGGINRFNDDFESPGDFNGNAIKDAWLDVAASYQSTLGESFDRLKNSWKDITEGAAVVFGDEFDTFLDQVNEKLTSPLVTAIEGATSINPADSDGSSAGFMSNHNAGFSDMLAPLREFGDKISSFLGSVFEFAMQIESVAKIMDPLKIILEGILSVIAPIVNQILAPVIGILRILGQTIGAMLVPILQIFGPIIELLGLAFVWLYNKAILPFANFIIAAGNALYNGIIWIVNGLIGLLNKIPGVDITKIESRSLDDGALEAIGYENLNTAGAASTGSGSSGSGAAYTGGKNITNNWYINIGAFTADAETFQEFVRFITQEQKRLERLGMA